MIAILDNIRSSHNVGSIFRTSDGLGVEKLYLCGITPSPIDRFGRENTNMTKVSLGAENFVKWEKTENTRDTLKKLKTQSYEIIAIEQNEKSKSILKAKIKGEKIALVFGEEVKGLKKETLDLCDEIFEIPMKGKKESFNVAIAYAIACYELIGK